MGRVCPVAADCGGAVPPSVVSRQSSDGIGGLGDALLGGLDDLAGALPRPRTCLQLGDRQARIGVAQPHPQPPHYRNPGEDAFRHVAESYGDDNPLWCDPDHARASVWAGPIAPPPLNGGDTLVGVNEVATLDPEKLEAAFRQPPAIHRFPRAMAERVQELCQVVADEYGGNAERIWTEAADAAELRRGGRAAPEPAGRRGG